MAAKAGSRDFYIPTFQNIFYTMMISEMQIIFKNLLNQMCKIEKEVGTVKSHSATAMSLFNIE